MPITVSGAMQELGGTLPPQYSVMVSSTAADRLAPSPVVIDAAGAATGFTNIETGDLQATGAVNVNGNLGVGGAVTASGFSLPTRPVLTGNCGGNVILFDTIQAIAACGLVDASAVTL